MMQQKKQEAEERRAAAMGEKQSEAQPRSTFNLFGGLPATPATPAATPAAQTKAVSVAPKGVPSIRNWRQNPDGSITGQIFESPAFPDGEEITTSPIKGAGADGIVVQTNSGSRYFLDPTKTQKAPSFNFFGGGAPKAAAPVAPASVNAADERRQEAAAEA